MSAAKASDPVRVGVVGVGAMGLSHVRTLTRWVPAARVTGIHDFDEGRAREIGSEVSAQVFESAAALVAADTVDAVLVASPDTTHEGLVLACLDAGKPVLCEKPLATDPDGSRRIVDAEVSSGRRLVQVGFMRRYDAAYNELRTMVSAGGVGIPRVVHCVHRNVASHPSATSEAIIVNSMIHELDTVPWLLGGDPLVSVLVATPTVAEGELRDPQVALLETAGGVVATVEVFVNARYGYDIRCEVVGSDGSAMLTPPYGLGRRTEGLDGVVVSADFVQRFADAYRVELADWVASVRDGPARGASSWDGHRANLAAAAAVQSLRSRTRISIGADSRPPLYG